jgi:L-serine dehydratase
MTVELYPDLFNDVFGPVMQPGSSSHTAGPCRLGYLAHCLLGERPRMIRVILDAGGSFAGTFGLMSEDQAMVAGALGFLPDDRRLFDARAIARSEGIEVSFEFGALPESLHANAVKFVLRGGTGCQVTLVGDSIGGGMIETRRVNGFQLGIRGDTFVLLLFDRGRRMADSAFQAFQARLSDVVGSGTAVGDGPGRLWFVKTAAAPDLDAVRSELPQVEVALLRPILPVITRPDRQPQLFDTMTRWRQIASERNLPLWEVAVHYEMDASGWTRDEVIAYLEQLCDRMHRQTHAVYEEDLAVPTTPFRPHFAADWARHMQSPARLTDDLTAATIRWAYGAGAGIPGVETVAGPMGSGGGYIYGALYAVQLARGFSDRDLLRGLFVAAGVGAIAFSRTEPTGEVIGCTGECGISGAMAAAGIAEMAGGTPEQVENAASLHLQAFIGLPCDPIPGGFGQPCRSRILATTCMAGVFADLALAGRQAVVPLHEVIDVADHVGRRLPPELLCTSRGGLPSTPTARRQATAYARWVEQTERDGTPRPPGNLI